MVGELMSLVFSYVLTLGVGILIVLKLFDWFNR